ncbi:type II toxin-antitoxin system VapC family toxin [Candidatus Poriferisodalis sp.]|uniref:type II toxin-antitoxin system VapC family toxin n=1 Tax=Candidatus Poriferisodalis sp. TaxID=3101277 RepID=UPI003B517262
MIVVDASVAVPAVAEFGDRGTSALLRIHQDRSLAPHILDLEVTHVLRSMCTRGELSERVARRGLQKLLSLKIIRVAHEPLLARCWELRHNVSAYDASYVALAEQTGATLLTRDVRLARAPGIECEVELFGSAA